MENVNTTACTISSRRSTWYRHNASRYTKNFHTACPHSKRRRAVNYTQRSNTYFTTTAVQAVSATVSIRIPQPYRRRTALGTPMHTIGQGWVFRAETELSKSVARQTYPLDGGNAALAPALRVQFEIPDGVLVPKTPEVRWELGFAFGGGEQKISCCPCPAIIDHAPPNSLDMCTPSTLVRSQVEALARSAGGRGAVGI